MKKCLVTFLCLCLICFYSIVPVHAAGDSESSLVSDLPAVSDQASEPEAVEQSNEDLSLLLFAVSILVGIQLGRAFSFWKW